MHIDIYYDQCSAQATYLSTHNLLQPQQTLPYTPLDDHHFLYNEDYQFKEQEREDEEDQDMVDGQTFEEYVGKMMGMGSRGVGGKGGRRIMGVLVGVVGEVMELGYGGREGGGGRMWVLGHLLVGIAALWMAPLLTITVLIGLFLLMPTQQPLQSQLTFHQQTPSLLSHTLSLLKPHLPHIPPPLLSSLLTSLLLKYHLQPQQSSQTLTTVMIMDQLTEVIYRIGCKIRERKMRIGFERGEGWIQRKIWYWRVRKENGRVREIVQMIEDIVGIAKKRSKDIKNRNTPAKIMQSVQKQIYFSIILHKLLQTNHPQPYLSLLHSQLNHRRLIFLSHSPPTTSIEPLFQLQLEPSPSQQPKNFINTFQKQQKPLIYHGDHCEIYVPEEYEVVKNNIQKVLKERRKNIQETTNKEQERKEKVYEQIEKEVRDGKVERRVFGIPLMPPKRDMSMYYLE